MPEVKIALSAYERLQKHAKRLRLPVGEVIQLALNEFDSAQEVSENSPKDHPKKSKTPARSRKPRSIEPSKTRKKSKSRPAKPKDPVRESKGRDLVRRIDPKNLPSLKHVEIIVAKINGNRIEKPNWNKLVRQMLVRVLRKNTSIKDIKGMCSANIVPGEKYDEGFSPIEGVDVSYQNLSAGPACKTILALAKHINAEVDIGLRWKDKPDAEFPSQRRRLLFNRKPSIRSSTGSSGGRR